MRSTSIIFGREIGSLLRSPIGYIIAAIALLSAGIVFQAIALGSSDKLSADVLRQFFWVMSGVVIFMSVALSFHLIAMERHNNTILLLNTSPVKDTDIILGKFLSAFLFLGLLLLLSVYLPLLILVNGKLTFSQLFVGYMGLWLLGGTVIAIGIFASAISSHVLVSAIVAIAITGIMVLLFPLAKTMDAPLKTVFQELDLWHVHFQGGFMVGVITLKDTVYYLAVTYFFLLSATKAMELRRWR